MAVTNNFQRLLLRLQDNCIVYYVEGSNDDYFGRAFSAAFLPFTADNSSPYGLYFIAGHNKFYYRIEERGEETTRLLLPLEDKEFRMHLAAIIEKVISTRSNCVNEAVKLVMAGKKPKVLREFSSNVPVPATAGRFLILNGSKSPSNK